jgi:hypothetical protein
MLLTYTKLIHFIAKVYLLTYACVLVYAVSLLYFSVGVCVKSLKLQVFFTLGLIFYVRLKTSNSECGLTYGDDELMAVTVRERQR